MTYSASEDPSMQTLLGFHDAEILKVAEKVYRESVQLNPVYSPTDNMMSAWESCAKILPGTWPGPAYRARLGQLDPLQEAKDIPTAVPSQRFVPPQQALGGQRWPSTPEGKSESGRCSHSRVRDKVRQHWSPSPQCPSRHQSPSPVLHDPILLMSSSATLWKTKTCKQDSMNPGAVHGEMTPQHWLRNWRIRLGLMWKGTWVMTPHFPRP